MGVKTNMCDIVKMLKEDQGLTYDEVINKCGKEILFKSQLTNILNHDGKNVSVEHIEYIINKLGGHLEVHLCINLE